MNRQNMRAPGKAPGPAAIPTGLERWQVPGICLLLAAITIAVFGQTVGHDFVNYDDDLYVYGNSLVKSGLTPAGLAQIFSHPQCNLYHPLTMLSLMVDYQVHGLHPGGYHLVNVLLHTASAVLLFLVLQRMTGALWPGALTAAIFAIHPLRAESVAWVSERKDVLAAFFFVLTLAVYDRYVRKPDLPRYLTMAAAYVLALLSKPTIVTLPFVLLLLDFWPLRRSQGWPRLIWEKIPLLLLAAGACVLTVMAAKGSITPALPVPWLARVGYAFVYYVIYLRKMVWPLDLAVPYPAARYSTGEMALAGILLAGLSIIAWMGRRKRPWLLVGWLWYLGMLLPMIGLTPVATFPVADRYTYVPQIGLYLALAWLAAEWHLSRAAVGTLMAGVIGLLLVCAWQQVACWKNSETLWSQTLACTTNNYVAEDNLGIALFQKDDLDHAIQHFQAALQIRPQFAQARNNLGTALLSAGQTNSAIACFQQAIQDDPNFAAPHTDLAEAFIAQGKVDESIAECRQALQIDPNDAEACVNLGNDLYKKGKVDEAIGQFRRALQIDPQLDTAQKNLDILLRQTPDRTRLAQ